MTVRVEVGVLDDVMGVVVADNATGFHYEGKLPDNLRRMVRLAEMQLARKRGASLLPEEVARALPGWVRGYTWAQIIEAGAAGEEQQQP